MTLSITPQLKKLRELPIGLKNELSKTIESQNTNKLFFIINKTHFETEIKMVAIFQTIFQLHFSGYI